MSNNTKTINTVELLKATPESVLVYVYRYPVEDNMYVRLQLDGKLEVQLLKTRTSPTLTGIDALAHLRETLGYDTMGFLNDLFGHIKTQIKNRMKQDLYILSELKGGMEFQLCALADAEAEEEG